MFLLVPPGGQLPPGHAAPNMMSHGGPPGAPPSFAHPRPAAAQVFDECRGDGNPSPLQHDGLLLPQPYSTMTTNTWMIQQPIQLLRPEAELYHNKDTCY